MQNELQSQTLNPQQVLLVTLTVKLAVTAVLATMLARFRLFRRILLTERRDWPERLIFAAGYGIPLTAGVAARLLLHYDAADLTLSGSFLTGLIAGPYSGALVGASVSIPAMLAGEWGALPFAVGCGFAGGGLRELCPKEEIWKFTPFFFTRLFQSIWRQVRNVTLDWQIVLVAAPVLLEFLRLTITTRFHWAHPRLFALQPTEPWHWALIPLVTVMAVAIPIKIWNSARIEHRLAEQEHLLMVARVDALANQINPHFLFNTLTSISSLIRSQPETARVLIVKLSALLRRLLRSQEHFVTLREEIEAVDEYLDIERIRFGPTLVVDKQIESGTLDVIVPSMILQPLVENSIKHGLGRKLGEGRITLQSSRADGMLVIEVRDNGVGMAQTRME
jgi:two-component system LytT family sensor kinase